jgi:hypothetical protein
MRRLSTEWLLSSLKLHGVNSVESLNQQLWLDHSSANSAKRVNKHYSHEASLLAGVIDKIANGKVDEALVMLVVRFTAIHNIFFVIASATGIAIAPEVTSIDLQINRAINSALRLNKRPYSSSTSAFSNSAPLVPSDTATTATQVVVEVVDVGVHK